MGLEPFDIEDLLVWAYRDQCVDRVVGLQERKGEPCAFAATFGAFKMLEEIGILVQTTGAGLAALGARVHEDAELVHARVLALGDMFLELDGDEVRVWDRADETAGGFALRDTARGWEVRRPDGFVRPVMRAVTTGLLVLHAKNASRPDCCIGWQPGMKPRRVDRIGRTVTDHDAAEVGADEVMIARATYHVWRQALCALQADLDGALTSWSVTGPRAPDAPWLTHTAPPRVHDGGEIDPASHRKLLRRKGYRPFDRDDPLTLP